MSENARNRPRKISELPPAPGPIDMRVHQQEFARIMRIDEKPPLGGECRCGCAELCARIERLEVFMAGERSSKTSLANLIARLAFETGIPVAVLAGQVRQARVVRVRHAYYWLGARVLGRSIAGVGRALGDRDHKTVFTGLVRADALRDSDPSFRRLTDLIAAECSQGQLS